MGLLTSKMGPFLDKVQNNDGWITLQGCLVVENRCRYFLLHFMWAFQKTNFQGPTPKQSTTSGLKVNSDGYKKGKKKNYAQNPQVVGGPLLRATYLHVEGEMNQNWWDPFWSLDSGDSKYPSFSLQLFISKKLWPPQNPIFRGGSRKLMGLWVAKTYGTDCISKINLFE